MTKSISGDKFCDVGSFGDQLVADCGAESKDIPGA